MVCGSCFISSMTWGGYFLLKLVMTYPIRLSVFKYWPTILILCLLTELVSGRHERLGDAVLAAQTAYAHTGALPELLNNYHLLGDPALTQPHASPLEQRFVA